MVSKKSEVVEIILQLVSRLSEEQKKELIDNLLKKEEGLPISIFRSGISGLEAIVVYLKETKNKSIAEIAALLKRKKSTIYTTYQKAKRKLNKPLDTSDCSILVPYQIFAHRKFSVLESLAKYLKDEQKIPFVKISALLDKKYSTVRTVYVRYRTKNASK